MYTAFTPIPTTHQQGVSYSPCQLSPAASNLPSATLLRSSASNYDVYFVNQLSTYILILRLLATNASYSTALPR